MNITDIDMGMMDMDITFQEPGEKLFHALTYVNGVTCFFTIICKLLVY